MPPFFFRDNKQAEVHTLVTQYCALVGQCVDEWCAMIRVYLQDPASADERSTRVHVLEGEADKVRFKVERKMHKGAFLPAYREDYILLLEAVDRVANKCEESASLLDLTRPVLPEAIREQVLAMVQATDEAWEPVPELVEGVFTNTFKTKKTVKQISRKEHEVDDHQYAVLRWIFHESGLPLAEKMLLRDIVNGMGSVSDRIEDAGDRINLIGIKRTMA